MMMKKNRVWPLRHSYLLGFKAGCVLKMGRNSRGLLLRQIHCSATQKSGIWDQIWSNKRNHRRKEYLDLGIAMKLKIRGASTSSFLQHTRLRQLLITNRYCFGVTQQNQDEQNLRGEHIAEIKFNFKTRKGIEVSNSCAIVKELRELLVPVVTNFRGHPHHCSIFNFRNGLDAQHPHGSLYSSLVLYIFS